MVVFLQMESPESKGLVMFCGCVDSIPRYRILINNLTTEEEQRKTLAHELIIYIIIVEKQVLISLGMKE